MCWLVVGISLKLSYVLLVHFCRWTMYSKIFRLCTHTKHPTWSAQQQQHFSWCRNCWATQTMSLGLASMGLQKSNNDRWHQRWCWEWYVIWMFLFFVIDFTIIVDDKIKPFRHRLLVDCLLTIRVLCYLPVTMTNSLCVESLKNTQNWP